MPKPSINKSVQAYLELYCKLLNLRQCDQDSNEAEAIRSEMDELWKDIDPAEIIAFIKKHYSNIPERR